MLAIQIDNPKIEESLKAQFSSINDIKKYRNHSALQKKVGMKVA